MGSQRGGLVGREVELIDMSGDSHGYMSTADRSQAYTVFCIYTFKHIPHVAVGRKTIISSTTCKAFPRGGIGNIRHGRGVAFS